MKKLVVISLFVLACAGAYAATPDFNTPEWRLSDAVLRRDTDAVQGAIDDGATNAATVLRDRLAFLRPGQLSVRDIEIFKILTQASGTLITTDQANAFVVAAISHNCTADKNESYDNTFNIADIVGIAPWDYQITPALLEQIAAIAATDDYRPDIMECVFNTVSKYKLAGMDFIDIASGVADARGAIHLRAFIDDLRDEIARQTSGE